ncbi:GDSL-type esterase/lipase family protein [Leptolyngbya sp. DQ-M1]|uniref:GDSL-type esterase/lipase family protein n=1 Tax=Leptolyngbya sp. DQ-M1 TaxID=2933920 RepID=UPI0032977EF8
MQILVSPSAHSTVSPTASLRILAIGDSIVYGFGDPVGGGWVERLRRRWMSPGEANHALYNLGVRGDGVRHVARRLEDEFRHRGELRNRVPDLIILSVGVNDSPRLSKPDGKNVLPFEVFQTEIADLLDRSLRLCPVLFVGMIPVDEAKMPFLDCMYYNHADQMRYNEAIRSTCEARQIPHLNLLEIWRSRGSDWCKQQFTEDGLHPNVSGYQALLEDISNWDAFRQWIEP